MLFALMLLLVTLMVMMTLSFGTKTKAKMELQQVADQAAYSNAVVVARGFNSIALLNRVQIAHMVAIAGIQSALSYAASYRGLLQGAEQAIKVSMGKHGSRCKIVVKPECTAARDLREPMNQVRDEQDRVEREWTRPTILGAMLGSFGMADAAVGFYAMLWQMNALSIFLVHQMETFERLASKLDEQTLARAIMTHATYGGTPWVVPPGASYVSTREVGDIRTGTGVLNGATVKTSFFNQHAVMAAMAARGNWWVTARLGEGGLLEKRLNAVFNPPPGSTNSVPFMLRRLPVKFDTPTDLVVDAVIGKMESDNWISTAVIPLPSFDPTITVQLSTPSMLFPLPPMPSWFPSGLAGKISGLMPYMGKGDAYFGAKRHAARLPFGPDDKAIIADDHAGGTLYYYKAPYWDLRPVPSIAIGALPLAEPLPFSGFGFASAGVGMQNKHEWYGFPFPLTMSEFIVESGGMVPGLGGVGAGGNKDRAPLHMLAPLSGTGVFPPFIDFNPTKVARSDDAFGQPKNFAVIQRNFADPSKSPDPWNLFFRFRLNGTGEKYGQGTATNRNAIILQDGTDISMQTALASGLAYYHHYGAWRETPNLFNPFWRAGLTRANIDESDGYGQKWWEDVSDTMDRSGVPWAGEAIRELNRVGFQGAP